MEDKKEFIAQLLKGIDRYNPENLTILEKHVEIQAENQFSDLEANLAVLKLYQFNPMCIKKPIINLIVQIAMTQLPAIDFVLCKALIDLDLYDETKNTDDLVTLMSLATSLDTCDFVKFWDEIEKNRIDFSQVKGFIHSIKIFICKSLNNSFLNIHIDELTKMLGGVSDKELKEWIQYNGWKRNTAGEIFIRNQDHIIKTKNIKEIITFENVTKIMSNGMNLCKPN